MKILFTDNGLHENFYPISLTRPLVEMRFGILTIKETWEKLFLSHNIQIETFYKTKDYLSNKFPSHQVFDYIIAGNVKPNENLVKEILTLNDKEGLYVNNQWICTKNNEIESSKKEIQTNDILFLKNIWQLFQYNDKAIEIDFKILTKNKKSATISPTNQFKERENIFIEEGAIVEFSILNPHGGYIYISKNTEIMEGVMIRGSLALCDGATIKMGAKIYGPTTIGSYCKVGGEISNSIFQSYSNKGHDGFIGNSVIGEWCNLGADTNSSNLKNNYGFVKIYNHLTKNLEQTDLTFCGVLMGDHTKTGINTMLNTATTIGVSSNVYGSDFPAKYIPSFQWGSANKMESFNFEKALEVANNMMQRRNVNLTQNDTEILKYIFDNKL